MNGPANYLMAEEALKSARAAADTWGQTYWLESAKVHALQANTAAVIDTARGFGADPAGGREWDKAIK